MLILILECVLVLNAAKALGAISPSLFFSVFQWFVLFYNLCVCSGSGTWLFMVYVSFMSHWIDFRIVTLVQY